MSIFERYLTLWVALCITDGIDGLLIVPSEETRQLPHEAVAIRSRSDAHRNWSDVYRARVRMSDIP